MEEKRKDLDGEKEKILSHYKTLVSLFKTLFTLIFCSALIAIVVYLSIASKIVYSAAINLERLDSHLQIKNQGLVVLEWFGASFMVLIAIVLLLFISWLFVRRMLIIIQEKDYKKQFTDLDVGKEKKKIYSTKVYKFFKL